MKKILNILLGVMMAITAVLLVYAMATGGSEAAIGANLIWGYFLFVFAIAAALSCAVYAPVTRSTSSTCRTTGSSATAKP